METAPSEAFSGAAVEIMEVDNKDINTDTTEEVSEINIFHYYKTTITTSFYPYLFLVPFLWYGHKPVKSVRQLSFAGSVERDIMSTLKESLVSKHGSLLMSVRSFWNVWDTCLEVMFMLIVFLFKSAIFVIRTAQFGF